MTMAMRARMLVLAAGLTLSACGKPAESPAEPPAGEATTATATPAASAVPATPAEIAATGAMVFKRCVACHTVDKGGANGIGPNLWNVHGSTIGTHAADYSYSTAMRSHGGVWDDATLDAYLTNPMKTIPGTKMSFAGVPSPEDRAALIAWLATKKD